ncbi:MAG: VanW family protein [Thermincolia bacterium]
MSLTKKVAVGLGVIVFLGAISLGIAVKVLLLHDLIVEGVRVKGIDLGNLTKQEAKNELRNLENTMGQTTIDLRYGEKSWSLGLAEAGLTLNMDKMIEEAYGYGRKGNLWNQYSTRQELARQGVELPLKVMVNEQVIKTKVKTLTKELAVEPRDATFRINDDDRVEVIKENIGWGVNWQKVKEDIKVAALEDNNPEIKLQLEEVKPGRTSEDVYRMQINGLVSQFSTHFNPSQANRTYNITVASEALNGLLVKPGEVVSFNNIVGPRSTEAGYREAPVVVNNELVPGIGGGVCQVSSTLYNSLLIGNFEIVYRRNHSIPVGYVPVGRDATVTYGGIDFKFRNNRNSYMFIKSSMKGNVITFKLFGNLDEKRQVEIIDTVTQVTEQKVIYEKDPNLDRGKEVVKEPGRKGYRTTTVRMVYEKGKVVNREVITKSIYKPKDKIIAVGIRKPATPKIPAPKQPANPPVNSGQIDEPVSPPVNNQGLEPAPQPLPENPDSIPNQTPAGI